MRIILIAALFSLPIVAAATTQTLAAGNYGSSATGGGSAGYNHGVATDYRLKKHHRVKKLHASAKPQAAAPQAPKTTPGQSGGAAAKQPMGRP
jgi:hypothetical protein